MTGARVGAMLLAAWLALSTGVMAQKAAPATAQKPPAGVAIMLFAELDKLNAVPVLTPDSVAQVTGVVWTGGETRSLAYRMIRGAGTAGRLVKAAELRLPLPGSDAKGEILVLDLAPGSGLTVADVVARMGRTSDIEIPIAAAPPTEPVYYRHRVGTALVSFGVARSKAHEVVSIVIDRTAPQ